jgi:transposase-like protein
LWRSAALVKLGVSAIHPVLRLCTGDRKIIYTTNAIESLHSQVRNTARGRGRFPSDQTATKSIWFVLENVAAKWKSEPIIWHAAKAQFAIRFEYRFIS